MGRATYTEGIVVVRAKLAGTWYEADPMTLRGELESWLSAAPDEPHPDVMALILPHAGYRYSGPTAARGVALVRGQAYRRVIVLGPSHRFPLRNKVALPPGSSFITPLGDIPFDRTAFDALLAHPAIEVLPAAHEGEHCIEIQLPMLQAALPSFELVPLVVGDVDEATMQGIAQALRGIVDEHTLVVVSSDFTHFGRRFGYEPFRTDVLARLEELDRGAFDTIRRGDAAAFATYVRDTGATICGRRPIEILLRMLPAAVRVHLLAYETSGHLTQDVEHSVSYLAASFEGAWGDPTVARLGLGEADGEALLRLAREAIRYWLEHRKVPAPEDLPIALSPALQQGAGVFVTLRQGHALRGCIGHVRPDGPLARAVVQSAVGAAAHDRRFSPVEGEELDDLTVAVSVLTPPRAVAGPEAIRLGRDGILLEREGRSAVFLPEVATDQGWDLETTLTHLGQKAGLPPDAWQRDAAYEVFQSIQFVETRPRPIS